GFNVAVVRRPRKLASGRRGTRCRPPASMWPWSADHETSPPRPRRRHRSDCFNVAVVRRPRKPRLRPTGATSFAVLQCGRGPQTTETLNAKRTPPRHTTLQCGRGPQTTETPTLLLVDLARQNASMWPWSADHG